MTIEEFRARLDKFDEHIATAMQMFEDDTGIEIVSVEAFSSSDGTISVHTGLDFPEQKEVQ